MTILDGGEEARQLARQAFKTAGRLHLLAERLRFVQPGTPTYSPAELDAVAEALRDLAAQQAARTGDMELVEEITGRETATPAAAQCPRCGGPLLHSGLSHTVTGRLLICGLCCTDEMMRAARRLPPLPPPEWPVTLPTWQKAGGKNRKPDQPPGGPINPV